MSNVKAIMFDLDGTLLDTLADLSDSMNQALTSLGFPEHQTNFYKTAVGDGIRLLAERSLPGNQRSEAMTNRLVETMRGIYNENWMNQTQPYNDIPKLLAALQSRNILIAVLSNKPDQKTRECVDHYFGLNAFGHVMGASDHFPLKPDPAAVFDILKTTKTNKQDWLYVGDTNTDMQTAKNAGITSVGVSWGFRDSQELLDHGANIIIDAPLDLLNHI